MKGASRILSFTSPQGGEVGTRSVPGEGVLHSFHFVTPHPNPLPAGEREKAELAR